MLANDVLTLVPAGPPSTISQTVARVRAGFDRGKTRSLAWREAQLNALLRMLKQEEPRILDALHRDLGKPKQEAASAEVLECAMNVRYLLKNLARWMRPERVATPLAAWPGRSQIVREPKGVALIIAPWNYPFSLVFHPLGGALAAGNSVVVKPSELAPATSALIAELYPRYLDPDCVAVVRGGVAETTELLAERFDHIFYTGNGAVGRVVLEAAAKHLTPVTLELGGKSPAYVDRSADLDVTTKRLSWAKFYNCGQTCVAPDYALVHRDVYEPFLSKLVEAVQAMWGADPRLGTDYGRIVNAHHHARVMRLIASGGTPVLGGKGDVAQRYIAPTILRDVHASSAVMHEEIFGPVLPVLPVDSVEQAIAFINAREKPLALYAFAKDAPVCERFQNETSSGGITINHAMLHLTIPGLPFGGVGASGMGAYHGQFSMDTFSHRKAVHRRALWGEPELMYPPYDDRKLAWIRRLF
ncbi:MAG TPA: aldehyde dehydrogenase family protein [Polyangiales bacterium]|nr:aldehyde dehydrogenase family protein [Polyangiales bacterium]